MSDVQREAEEIVAQEQALAFAERWRQLQEQAKDGGVRVVRLGWEIRGGES